MSDSLPLHQIPDWIVFLEHHPLGVLLSTATGQILWANDIACRGLRCTQEQLQGRHLTTLIPLPPATREQSRERLQALRAQRRIPNPAHYAVHLPDGALRRFEVHSHILTRTPGSAEMICTLFRDVTEEHRAEEKLREQERRLQQLTAATTEGIVFHRDLHIVDCNPALAEMLHTTVEDVVGSSAAEFLPPEALVQVRPVLAARAIGHYSFSVRRRDGSTFPAELSGRPIQVDGEWLRVVSVRDISARKAAEDALEDAQARFAALSRAAPVGLARFSETLALEECNDAWAEQIGAPTADLLGDRWQQWLQPQDAPLVLAAMRETADHLLPHSGVFRVRSSTKQERWIEGHFSAHQGRPGSFISAVTDVTARIQAEKQRTRALREKEVLLREVHHRVKNNLLLVSSLLLLQQAQSNDPELARVFGNLQARINAMALVHKLVYQSESLSRVDAAPYSRALIDGLHSSMRPPGTEVTITAAVTPVHMEVHQAIPFGLLLNELLTNALQHAFPRRDTGHISIDFAPLPDRPGWWQLHLADDGIGMDLTTPPRQGALGNQLIEMLAEQLDGTVQRHPQPDGAGLVVTVTVPLRRAP